MGLRPICLANGIVSTVPIKPPILKTFVANLIHSWINCWVAVAANPRRDASVFARPVATVPMNALQLHHVISATNAIPRPLSVIVRNCGENNSLIDGAAVTPAFRQRSGSLMKNRTTKATPAGTSPNKKT